MEVQVLRQKRDIKVEVKLLALQKGFCGCGFTTPISAAAHRIPGYPWPASCLILLRLLPHTKKISKDSC